MIRFLNRVHLFYLCSLPALATYALLRRYEYPFVLLIFLVGIALVGVYLATVLSYTEVKGSIVWVLVALFDGPVFVFLSTLKHPSVNTVAVESFLIDGAAIWIAIGILAAFSGRPTPGQRKASLALAGAALGLITLLAWPYFREFVFGNGIKALLLSGGVFEALFVRYYLFKKDQIVRRHDEITLPLVVFIFLWIAALAAGNVLRELE